MKQLILLLTVAAVVGHSQAQGNRKCAANGEYCLTHSECCSGSCLSFSYKCVPVPPSASVGTTFVPVTVDTANRFGEDDGGASITQKTCAKNGEYCLTHSECCSGSCLSFSYKCVPIPGQPAQPGETAQQPQRPPLQTSTTVDVGNRVGEGEQGSTVPVTHLTPPPPKKCAALGEYCLTSADCCSKSCLSFSYKCVGNYDLGSQVTQQGIPVQRPSGAGNSGSIETSNRFGGSDSNRQCTANGLYCFHSGECCSGACFKSYCATEIKLGVPESDLTRPSPANGPYVQVNSLDDLITRFGGGGQQADSSVSASSKLGNLVTGRADIEKNCAVVGEGCSRQEDCCSHRCHSYRRKCVT
uniref:Uncharacterized protein n=1 Tax=Culex quinquefasciatus TaxID=7176 RepID=A0A1S4J244_CULQU